MNRSHFLPFLLLPLLLSTPALTAHAGTSHQVIAPYTPDTGDRFSYSIDSSGGMNAEAMGIFKAELDKQLSAAGLKAGSGVTRRALIHIETCKMRPGAARGWLGGFVGKDTILSTTTVVDAKTGKKLGSLQVKSGNVTAMGTAHGLIKGHADEIVEFLRGGGQ